METATLEFRFAVDCCRATFSGNVERPDTGLIDSIDLSLFVRVARFHRIQGLVWNAIAKWAPARRDEFRILADDAAAIAAANLKAGLECRALLAAFDAASVRLIFLKGLTVGTLAYGSASLKSAVDIDLLIRPEDLLAAAGLLERRGYLLTIPSGPMARLAKWHRVRKESVWLAPNSGMQIDLHTHAADNPKMIPTIGADSAMRMVDLGNGIQLPTLEATETFAYLAVHGASSAWFRLKWISDFAALLAGKPASEIDALYRRSEELGAGRAPAQGLLLADRLFGTLAQNRQLKTELLADRGNRILYRAGLAQLAGGTVEPTSRPFGTARIHWTQLLLKSGLRFKMHEVARQIRSTFA